MGGITVTRHAAERYAERVHQCSPAEATAAIHSHDKAIRAAAEFGSRTVKLASKHRLILKGTRVLTVLTAKRYDPGASAAN